MTPTSTVPPFRVRDDDLLRTWLRAWRSGGVTRLEIERTLNEGWAAGDAKTGTLGRVMVFAYGAEWEGRYYDEKKR